MTPDTLREWADKVDHAPDPQEQTVEADDLRAAADAWEALEDDMRQIEQVTRMVMEERCPSDEHHCTCVPLLRAELVASEQARQRARQEAMTFMGYLADRQGTGKDCAASYMIERLARVLAILAPNDTKQAKDDPSPEGQN